MLFALMFDSLPVGLALGLRFGAASGASTSEGDGDHESNEPDQKD